MNKELKIEDFKAIPRWSDRKIHSPLLRQLQLENGRRLPLLYFPELEAGDMVRTGFPVIDQKILFQVCFTLLLETLYHI